MRREAAAEGTRGAVGGPATADEGRLGSRSHGCFPRAIAAAAVVVGRLQKARSIVGRPLNGY